MVVRTEQLSIVVNSEQRLERLEIIHQLRGEGLMFNEIAELLNYKGVKTPTGKLYTANNVERSLVKYLRRLHRYDSTDIISVEESCYIG